MSERELTPADFEAAVEHLREHRGTAEAGRGEAPVTGYAFAPGEAAQHPYGILYQGEWETPADGTSGAVRLHARALAATGMPVLLKSFSGTVVNADGVAEPVPAVGVPVVVKREVGLLPETSIATLALSIKHVVLRDAEHARRIIMPRYVVHDDPTLMVALRKAIQNSTVLYSVWERDRLEHELAQQLRRVAQNWVPCSQNRELLAASGIQEERIHVVPHPFDEQDPICKLTRRNPAKHQQKKFYAIGRWEPRKGYAELIDAFLASHRPGDGSTLTIKYHGGTWDGYPTPHEALKRSREQHGWPENEATLAVQLIGTRLPRDRILELHFRNNIYVASSHGEAWCLPAFEAKLAGNRVVHVPFGGTEDFCGSDDVRVPFTLGPVHPSYHWEPDAQWACFDQEALVGALSAVRAPERFQKPANFDRFTMAAVGRQMASLCLELLDTNLPESVAYLRSATAVM